MDLIESCLSIEGLDNQNLPRRGFSRQKRENSLTVDIVFNCLVWYTRYGEVDKNKGVALEGKSLRRMEGSTVLVGFRRGVCLVGSRVEVTLAKLRAHVR